MKEKAILGKNEKYLTFLHNLLHLQSQKSYGE